MIATIMPGKITGEIAVIPSKSNLHRLLIYAALADRETFIICAETEAEDIKATIDCLTALGANITRSSGGFNITPLDRNLKTDNPILLPCRESGSTLRFMLPVVCALGVHGIFEMKGRLPQRPLSPLDTQLENHGIRLWRDESNYLHCQGQLTSGDYNLPGNISSQYITGLLMALPLLEKPSRIVVTAPIESADYIIMTLEVAEAFAHKTQVRSLHHYSLERKGIPDPTWDTSKNIEFNKDMDFSRDIECITEGIGTFKSPKQIESEGDWSNAAFWMCAGAMPEGNILLKGMKKDSSQGDREICNILGKMGVNVRWEGDNLLIRENKRLSLEIDGRATPDLIPVLAAVAAVSEGTTIFKNASRLRIKESDRIMSTCKTLSGLGADITETPDGLRVVGKQTLRGGTVDAYGDHRIAMTAAIASAACTEPVIITDAQSVNKSYPSFWNDLELLGKNVRLTSEG